MDAESLSPTQSSVLIAQSSPGGPTAIAHETAIDLQFEREFAGSRRLYERARGAIAGGITHDSRNLSPFPIYVTHAKGAYKWDVDGHQLLDHWMGHGALLLGHNPEPIKAAMAAQLERGSHYGACHELEVEWAELITTLVPSAERVRFTMSGTEATMLAMRDARAYTGKSKVIRFAGHFHGWHDYAMVGYQPPFDVPTSVGIPGEVAETMLTARSNDVESVRRLLDAHSDVAAVILEPGGGSNGIIPPDVQFLRNLRGLTAERGVVLIFDEVITGFRYAPGGAQQRYGVTPDMTTLAKIVAGGLPGGAVAGKAEIMDVQTFTGALEHDRFHRVLHQGTFNANPMSAAAGVAMLRTVAEGWVTEKTDRLGEQLRDRLNEVFRRLGVAGGAFGDSSVFHLLLGEGVRQAVRDCDAERLMGSRGAANALRKALLLDGVDLMRSGGFVSTAHADAELSRTAAALDKALERLQAEGLA